jgi:predicted CXXCH cytochrome family protein
MILPLKKSHAQYFLFLFSLFIIISSCDRKPKFIVAESLFVGSKTCIECHEKEYHSWKHSDHDNAMDTAIVTTVLGDFNNAEFERDGFTSRFYIKDDKYYVHTQGPGGKPGDFQIAYTFGVRPLQQYLIPFEDGRYQCLQITWDTEKGQWYHLGDSVYKDQEILPDDWLYWTNNAQNWNGMCAECHSTNLQKNYNLETHVYTTTWSEIDVSCEACHGPGSEHNRWSEIDSLSRPEIDNYGLAVQTSNITSVQLVNQCAYCHARRTSFGDFVHPHDELFDIISPQLPIDPFYYHDGQIKEEDYVYASFTQSKMHKNNVRCTNCHDPHSLKLKYDGNNLCYQCHKQEDYEGYNHHFHSMYNEEGEPLVLENGEVLYVGEGSQCITCHMPGQYFMGVDYRRDHSMRIPRPDLSDKLGTPNACIQCHTDKSNSWAASYTEEWYSRSTRYHFGETMFKASINDTIAITMLIDILNDEKSSTLIMASATRYLANFPGGETQKLNRELLSREGPLVRREAVRNFVPADIEDLKTMIFPLLDDSTLMVRMEATSRLSVLNLWELDSLKAIKLSNSIEEYILASEYSADFSGSRHNLGNLYSNIGENEKAIENYKEAIRIDNQFYPAKINLAMLFNRIGKNKEAEGLLMEVVDDNHEMGDAYYSLGLLQSEMGNYDKSIVNLKKATELLPERSRIWFNLYNLFDFKNNITEAQNALNKCLELEPRNIEFLYAKIEFLLKQQREKEAVEVAKKVLEYYPDTQDKKDLQNFIHLNS